MRADMTAAYFDHATTGLVLAAIRRGEAPPSTATRLFNRRRVRVWSRMECDAFLHRRHYAGPAVNDNDPAFDPSEFM
jgi:hypothetical protein